MSKVLYALSREHDFDMGAERKLKVICKNLVPDNISSRPEDHAVCVEGKAAYAVSMDKGAARYSGMSVLLGFLYEEGAGPWSDPGADSPDGNFALFRVDEGNLEVVSDFAGSRTIWYYHDDEIFIASTSQRAIIMFLGSFSFDEKVIPWLLSTGSLGPNLSWDKRIKRLQPDARVLLDRQAWKITEKQNPANFVEVNRRPDEHQAFLAGAIKKAVGAIAPLDFKHWVLPLSGGYDSRGILCFINDSIGVPDDLRAVTWGLEESLAEAGNDAQVAQELARKIGVEHRYYHTDISPEPVEKVVDRFLFCSEGRVDHIAGYMDGMDIWKQFHDENIVGVIRGDEGFGWHPVTSDWDVRTAVGCRLCSDFRQLMELLDEVDWPSQELPRDMQQHEGETLEDWRDRLYHTYRMPSILSALSDIKFSYVEQINPLLSRGVLSAVRTLPDDLRTSKFLFRRIVDAMSPDVPFATSGANASPREILRKSSFAEIMKSEIRSEDAVNLLGDKFTEMIVQGIKVGEGRPRERKRSLKSLLKSILPSSMTDAFRRTVASPTVDGNILAFRVFMAVKMHKMLTADSAAVRD